ncbi:MAG TPA: hypothetical protein VLC46_00015 [Thermoanaerobaculia bacterium]|nr:hypothetical protein [Thermoanaerobaculia bacterium]
MIRRKLTVLALLLSPVASSLAADAPALRGTLCVTKEGALLRAASSCKPVEGVVVSIEPAEVDRQFLWVRDDKHQIVVGAIPKDATAIDLGPKERGTVVLALSGEKTRGWPADVELHFRADGKHGYDVALQDTDVARLTSVGIKPGSYEMSVTARHHLRLRRDTIVVKQGVPATLGALRLLAAPRLSATVMNARGDPLPSAVMTNPQGHVLASANVEGTLAAELPADLPPYVEVIADGFAPHRVPLDREAADIDLGHVVLRRGATLTVTLDRSRIAAVPLRVSVLTRGPDQRFRETAGQALKLTETGATFPPIEAGDYFLGIEGPTPLARYFEALRLPDDGIVEKRVSIDPIEITGEVLVGDRHATGGQLNLQPVGGGWEVAVGVDENGSFQAESWEKGTFAAYYISDPARDGTFVHQPLDATSSPTHWHIVISDRTLSGRIYDKETREPVPEVGLMKDYHTDAGGGGLGIVPVKQDGSFSLDAVEPGDYTFKATAQSYMPVAVHAHVSATDSPQTVDIPLERGIAVVVSIVTSFGDPIARATVIDGVGDGLNPDHIYASDGAGQLTLSLRPDEARTLYVLPEEGSFAIVDVRAANSADGVRVVVPPAVGSLRISASAAGKPLAGIIPLFRWNGRLVPPPVPRFFPFADPHKIGIWTDESGRAELQAMPEGVYEFFPVRTQEEEAAVVHGTSTITPVRVGFAGGSMEVVFDLDAP